MDAVNCPLHRDAPSLRGRSRRREGTASVDLVLSGHTHGGQVQLAGWAPVTPRGSGRYLEGWYGDHAEDGVPPMYVSRGVGTSGIPVRLGSRPELAVFEL